MGNVEAYALKCALLVMGFTATASQILTIRELLVVFHGNELSIGIILGNWLLLEAAGSFWGRKRADQTKKPVPSFAILQIAIGLCTIFSIIFIRSFRYLLDIPTGEALGIHYVALFSFAALAPVAFLDGYLFPLGCRNVAGIAKKEEASARVYLYQAGGSFIAGIVFVLYLISYLTSIEISVIILFLNLCAALLYVSSVRESLPIRVTAMLLMLVTIGSYFLSGTKWLHWMSSRLLWHEYSLLETRNSVYSNIAVIKNRDEYTFLLNGSPYATTPAPEMQIEEIAHFPLLFHEQPNDVLVIGGGAGGLLNELLKHPVKRIDYAEQDPLIIQTFRKFSTPLTEYELKHEKVRIYPREGRLFLKTTATDYDVAVTNLPVPSTLQLNRYYTTDFFKLVKEQLKENGIFSLKLPGSETFLSKEIRELNGTIYSSLKSVFPHVRIIVGEQNIFLASQDVSVETIGEKILVERLAARRIHADLIHDRYIQYKTDYGRFGQIQKDIASAGGKTVNRDFDPRGVFESALLANLITSPLMNSILKAIDTIPFYFYVLLIAVPVLILSARRNRFRLFVPFALISTGFTSMLMTVVLIFAFQIYYGDVYHYIGILTSSFMAGLALGSFWGMKRIDVRMFFIEGQLLLLTAIVYLFLSLTLEARVSQIAIFALMFYSGLLTGMEYPVAVRLSDTSCSGVSATAGKLYALDLLGAVAGAVLTAAVFIPTIGIKDTIILVMVLKSGSLLLCILGERARPFCEGISRA